MKLLGVQLAALRASSGMHGFAFFMEQGLGKTLTALAEFVDLVAAREVTRLVVVCPNSFKNGWKEEAEKQGLDFDFYIWDGNDNTYNWWLRQEFKKPPVLVVNYEAIRARKVMRGKSHVWHEGERSLQFQKFVEGKNAMIVFDESIQLATNNSAQTIGAIRLAKHFVYSRILSGKPIRQGPADLWGQMRCIYHLDGFEYQPFKTAFSRMGGFKMKQVMGAQNEDILAERIDPVVFRATKADWTDLPPKSWTIREYTLTPELKAKYKSMEDDFVLWINSDEVVTIDAAITKYMKLQQIQCGWIYDEDGKAHQLVDDDRNPRLQLLLDVLDTEVSGKVAIPYHHKPVLAQLLRALGGEQKCAYIKGGMSPNEISEQKRRFNEDDECRYILLQDGASKYGHTLLGSPTPGNMCYTMLFYENNYSLDTRSQIEDRIHRHGQTADAVLYLDLVGTPLDRDCVKALQRKENIFQAVFSKLRRQR